MLQVGKKASGTALSYAQFLCSFALPSAIDANKVNAQFKDGVLKVSLPKREEAKAKQIEVKIT